MSSVKFNIAGIITDSIVDGPGIRVSVFAQGCLHACVGCHNPSSHSFEEKHLMSVKEVYEIIKRNKLSKGVTFSGGEPFCQAQAFYELAKLLKEDGYEIACYTGYTYEEIKNSDETKNNLLNLLDILIDGKFVMPLRNLDLRFKGSENQRIIDVQESLEKNEIILSKDERWVGSC